MKMTQIKTLIVILAVLVSTALAGPKTKGNNKNGIHGTITSVGTRGFVLTIDAQKSSASNGGVTLNVVCDNNTKFLRGGAAVDPSEIKQGVKVSVVGSTLGNNEVQAMTVTIEGSAPKSK